MSRPTGRRGEGDAAACCLDALDFLKVRGNGGDSHDVIYDQVFLCVQFYMRVETSAD